MTSATEAQPRGLNISEAAFEPLSDIRAEHGESPIWSERDHSVWWVDVVGRKLLRSSLDGGTSVWPTPEAPGFVQQTPDGRLFVGMQSGIFQFTPATGVFHRHASLAQDGVRFNDACLDARGCIWAGTMDMDNLRDNGVLYRFDPSTQKLVTVCDGLRTVNGLAWDEERNRLYVSDSHPSVQTVWTLDVGELRSFSGQRKRFATFDDLAGRPDGAAIDRAGSYWIAGVGGGEIYRFAPDGQLTGIHRVPVTSPTKIAFGPGRDPEMVLTSFADGGSGGRLAIWKTPLGK